MNKKKIAIFLIIITVVIAIIINFFPQNKDNKIEKYLLKQGFSKYSNTFLYSKQTSSLDLNNYNDSIKKNKNSEYEILYFNIDTYKLTKDNFIYSDGINKNFTAEYDYTNDNLTYTYRINFNDTNIIMEGTYNNTNDFTCNNTFYSKIDIEKTIDDICDNVKFDVKSFSYEAKDLIKDIDLVTHMKK